MTKGHMEIQPEWEIATAMKYGGPPLLEGILHASRRPPATVRTVIRLRRTGFKNRPYLTTALTRQHL